MDTEICTFRLDIVSAGLQTVYLGYSKYWTPVILEYIQTVYLGYSKCWTPVILENIKTYFPFTVDVTVVDSSLECHLEAES